MFLHRNGPALRARLAASRLVRALPETGLFGCRRAADLIETHPLACYALAVLERVHPVGLSRPW